MTVDKLIFDALEGYLEIPDQEIDKEVLRGMARALWVHAYMMWATEVEPPPVLHGRNWDEATPDNAATRSASLQAAQALEEILGKANRMTQPPLAVMFWRALGEGKPPARWEPLAHRLGETVAHACLGAAELPADLSSFSMPEFSVMLDDDGHRISWDGGFSWAEEDDDDLTANPWPSSSVQSLLFPVSRYTQAQAKAWAKQHGFRYDHIDTTPHYYHLRQFEPPLGVPCRTIHIDEGGIRAIVCVSATQNPAKRLGIEVLLLEDDPKIQAGTIRLLREVLGSPHVIVADNVGAAIADMEVHHFGLIVSDVDVLGKKTGIDFFHFVEQHYPDMVDRFVFLTGNERAAEVHYRFVAKPATAADFKMVIRAPAPGARTAPPAPLPAVARPPSSPLSVTEFAQAIDTALPNIAYHTGSGGKPDTKFGRPGFEKYFIAAVWRHLVSTDPRFRSVSLTSFKQLVLQAWRARQLQLARADLVAAMDSDAVIQSETQADGATFHFIVLEHPPTATAGAALDPREVARAVHEVLPKVREEQSPDPEGRGYTVSRGAFGDKVFIAAIWRELVRDPRFRGMADPRRPEVPPAAFKRALLEANRLRYLDLARADMVGAMDRQEVADSEISDRGSSFHFVLR
jgi:hypothetical protein